VDYHAICYDRTKNIKIIMNVINVRIKKYNSKL